MATFQIHVLVEGGGDSGSFRFVAPSSGEVAVGSEAPGLKTEKKLCENHRRRSGH